jgi:hypothetical protein
VARAAGKGPFRGRKTPGEPYRHAETRVTVRLHAGLASSIPGGHVSRKSSGFVPFSPSEDGGPANPEPARLPAPRRRTSRASVACPGAGRAARRRLPRGHRAVFGAPPTPPARRYYRGLELLARKSIGDKLWLQASYVYSSLRGNYDGGVNEGSLETHPGGNSDFNFPDLWHNAYGRLNLDRSHRFRFDGYWVTPLRLAVGLQTYIQSGAPLNKRAYFCCWDLSLAYLVPRGTAGRLPTTWDSNLTLSYPIAIGPASVTLQAYVYNLFNQQIRTDENAVWSSVQQEGYPETIFDPNQTQSNEEYGQITVRTDPRLFRAAVRVSF